ncbi:MAG: metal-dependent phosphohydrolase [Planctomycetaceae bacterium]|nr:metal-dependent phosphohydrolase [Planctomycetaceae bacterium]
MSNAPQKRTRQQRVAAVELPPGTWAMLLANLQRGGVLLRMALAGLAALFLWGFSQSWDPPFEYRAGETPIRDVIARVDFTQPDPEATREAKEQARKLAIAVYDQDPKPITQLRAQLRSEIGKLLVATQYDEVDYDLWQQFQPTPAAGTPDPTDEELAAQFERFREALSDEKSLEEFYAKLGEAMAPLEQWGVMEALPPQHDANAEKISIRTPESESVEATRNVSDVLMNEATGRLQQALNEKLPSLDIAQRVYAWLAPRLRETKSTLTLNPDATRAAQDAAAEATPEQTKPYFAGQNVLAKAGDPLTADQIKLLRDEHDALLAQRTWGQRLRRSLSVMGMFVALYTLCGFYCYHRERRVLADLYRFCVLLAVATAAIALGKIICQQSWGADVIPLLLFGMIVAIAYQQEMALLLTASATLALVVISGHEFPQALVLMATCAGAILVLQQVRTRTKLLTVGFTAAVVGFFTTLGVGTLYAQDFSLTVQDGLWLMVWSVIAGSLMTVLLPSIEKVFQVQTDLSLMELGDPAHPLLQELIRRAPGTYNHSITVAALAETAADAIGARGLLVRVGAYFHDIGKMLKPGYFIENQSQGDNRHDALMPAMSTLVIIAHVKDGADLARQNKLPESIIDFIQQHHGTTLVEYFYRQASQKKSQEDPGGGEVDESSFRYPGPKPQSREAGVLMLADAVESASRVLKEPTPSRIETLVEDLSRKRLLDGQFDESGLTLEEVRKIGDSLVKSLTAVYHGRVKYPDQETA